MKSKVEKSMLSDVINFKADLGLLINEYYKIITIKTMIDILKYQISRLKEYEK